MRRIRCLVLLLILLGACGPEPGDAPPPGPPAASFPGATPAPVPIHPGTQRMVAELAAVAARAYELGAYFGRARLEEARTRLAALPDDTREFERVDLERYTAAQELRLGLNADAVKRLRAAWERREGERLHVEDPRTFWVAVELGVAYLRLAEEQNCVTCADGRSCLFPLDGTGVHERPEGARGAAEMFTIALRIQPDDLRSKWLLNVAHMALGTYPDGVPAAHRIAPGVFASDEEFPRFESVAPVLGIEGPLDASGGVVLEDLDGDGRLDLAISSWDPSGQLRVYRNRGDGTFEERTRDSGLLGLTGGLNLTHADYDGDGDEDILVLRGGWLAQEGRVPNSLLRNEGGLRFVDVTVEAGLGGSSFPTQTADWADFDLDGDLDLYVGNETSSQVDAPCQLFRNEGDGTFTDVARAAGVDNRGFTKGVVWGDVDGDRYADLFVSNMGEPNRLFRNRGDGTFEDVTERAGVARPVSSFPAWFWDFDNDGRLDLYVASFAVVYLPSVHGHSDFVSGAEIVARTYLGTADESDGARIYRGDGKGGFEDVTRAQRIGQPGFTMGSNFGDLDQDGWLDFYLGTGDPRYDTIIPNRMYRNRGGTGFSDVTTAGGFGHLQKGHGVVFGDFDDDGDQDVVQQLGGAFPGDAFKNAAYLNPGFGRRWLRLKLVGVTSNGGAVGARVRVDVEQPDGTSRSIHRTVDTGGSFGAGPLRLELGLGNAVRITAVEVVWPRKGDAVQTFGSLDLDAAYRIVEGQAAAQRTD